jgi:hypothetical protein
VGPAVEWVSQLALQGQPRVRTGAPCRENAGAADVKLTGEELTALTALADRVSGARY